MYYKRGEAYPPKSCKNQKSNICICLWFHCQNPKSQTIKICQYRIVMSILDMKISPLGGKLTWIKRNFNNFKQIFHIWSFQTCLQMSSHFNLCKKAFVLMILMIFFAEKILVQIFFKVSQWSLWPYWPLLALYGCVSKSFMGAVQNGLKWRPMQISNLGAS